MPLTKKPRGKIWWIRGTVRGKSVYESCGTDNEEIAEAIRIKRENELLNDSVFGAKSTRTFAQAAESYLKSGGSMRFLGKQNADGTWTGLIGRFYDKPLRTLRQADLQDAARDLYPACSAETVNRQCYTPFIAVYNHAVDNEWADLRKWRRPKKQKGTGAVRLNPKRAGNKPVAYDRAALFVAAMSPSPAMAMTIMFFTGLRPIELFALECGDVDVSGRWLVVRNSKTGDPRGVPIHEFIAPLLAGLVKRGGRLVRTHKGNPYPLTDEYGGQMSKAVDGARKRSGIRDVSPYTARHSVSTQLVMNGVHPYIKDQILGHAVTDMSRHYTNVPQRELIDAINTIEVPALWRRLGWWDDPLTASRKLLPMATLEEKEMRG